MNKNSFLKNVWILLVSQGIIKIVGIIYKLYLTNKTGFGDTGNALFFATFQVYTIFLTICSIGVPNAISYLVSAKFAIGDTKSAYKTFKIAILIFGIIGFISSVLMYFFAELIANMYLQMPETKLVFKVLAPSVFIVAITSVFKGYFNGKQKMNVTANSLSLEQITKTISTIIIVEILAKASNNNTLILVYAVGLTTTLGNIVSLLYIFIKYLDSKEEIWADLVTSKNIKEERIRAIVKKIFNVSFPIAICALIGSLNKTIDALTIVRITKAYLGNEDAIRQYGILSGKIESLIMFPLSFNMAFATVLIPKISEYKAKQKQKEAKNILKIIILFGILMGIPCFVIMFLFPSEILKFLFPYAISGELMLKYSSFSIILLIVIQTINSYLQGMNKMKVQMYSIGIGVVIKIILNIVLLNNKAIGVYGAIISNTISYMAILIILVTYIICREKIVFEVKRFFIKPIALILLMIFSLKYVYNKSNNLNIIFFSIIGCIIYVISVVIFKIISKKDLKIAQFGIHNTRKY